MEDWDDLWEEGWDDVPKQGANATLLPTGTVPAAVTCPVATGAAPGCASAATAAVSLALPPSHGGYRGPTLVHIDIKDVVAALPAEGTLLARDNVSWKERRGLTSAAHKIQRYAHIPEKRIEEFIGREEAWEEERLANSRNLSGGIQPFYYDSVPELKNVRNETNETKSKTKRTSKSKPTNHRRQNETTVHRNSRNRLVSCRSVDCLFEPHTHCDPQPATLRGANRTRSSERENRGYRR